MLTASGGRGDKLFQSTLTSLGDYDSCLGMSTSKISGRYCLADVFPIRWSPSFRQKFFSLLKLDEITVFRNFSFVTGVCMPVKCSDDDVRTIMSKTLEPHYFRLRGHFECQTAKENSFITRTINMTTAQVISLLFILTILGLVGLGTLLHVYRIWEQRNEISKVEELEEMIENTGNKFSSTFSILKNTQKLFSRSSNNHYFLLDMYKLGLVIFGCLAHAFVCVEIPNSYFLLENHHFLQNMFSSTRLQFALNDNGLVVFAHLGGFATFVTLYPMIVKMKKFPYLLTILDRYLRFLPSIMTIVAFEFLWPLLFDGPFFKRVGTFVLEKCSRSWWWNLTFLQNWFPVLDICGGHTFFSAVDMQLFILGLVCMSLMVKSQGKAILFCMVASGLAILRVLYNGYVHRSTMTMYTPWPDTKKILEYLDYIHMTTPIYIPGYFIGVLNGFLVHSGFRLPIRSLTDHLIYNMISFSLPGITIMINGLYNEFQVIDQVFVPPLIILNRLIQSVTCFLFLTYFMSIESKWSERLFFGSKYSFFGAWVRLSYSIYLSNYLIVKTEFFTSRSLFPMTTYTVFTRIISSIIVMHIAAFFFHLLFVAPFDGMRRMLFGWLKGKSPKDRKDRKDSDESLNVKEQSEKKKE